MDKKLSSCKKTNAVLNYIWSEFEANGEGNGNGFDVNSIRAYFMPKWLENPYRAGNLLLYIDDIRELFKQSGYKCESWSDAKVEKNYISAMYWTLLLYYEQCKKHYSIKTRTELAECLGFRKEYEQYKAKFLN